MGGTNLMKQFEEPSNELSRKHASTTGGSWLASPPALAVPPPVQVDSAEQFMINKSSESLCSKENMC